MSSRAKVNKLIMGLATDTGLPVAQEMYTGTETSFIVFSWVSASPVDYADDKPQHDESHVNVILYTPRKTNPSALIDLIRNSLEAKGFTVDEIWGPNLTPLGDSSKSDYCYQTVFETIYTDYH